MCITRLAKAICWNCRGDIQYDRTQWLCLEAEYYGITSPVHCENYDHEEATFDGFVCTLCREKYPGHDWKRLLLRKDGAVLGPKLYEEWLNGVDK